MHRSISFAVLALTVVHCYGAVQFQMPEAAEIQNPDDDLQAQVKELQKNVSDIWTYIYELRTAVSHHLTHLRQHQVELESSMHKMEHLHESELQSSGHHHSGEQHSHSGEHHSHSSEHSHGNDHSHGSMEESHSHSGEHHSHSDEHHSHSGEHHSHSGEHGHHSHSDSHTHTSHDHSKEDSHSHGGLDHKDSHETEDLQQETQKVEKPVLEPVVTAANITQEHHHHHHHSHGHSSRSGGDDSFNLLSENSYHHHHDHSHDSSTRSRNRTVEFPRYSDYGLYDLAMCRVLPNKAIPEEQQQNVAGTVTMWQKKTGGPLNFHVRLQGFEVGDHHAHHQQSVQEEDNETPQPTVGHRHGFHIHALGDLSNGCQSTGPHYNPKVVNHGSPDSLVRHAGDLGNIECDEHGNTNIIFSDDVASLTGQYSVLGKALVIHANEDDLGLGGDAESLRTGNAGTRIACCVINKADKIPIRQYRIMKSAVQHKNR